MNTAIRIHEAGHAVVAMIVGRSFTRIAMRRNGSFVDADELPGDARAAAHAAEALIAVAGVVAQRMATGEGTIPPQDFFLAAGAMTACGESWTTLPWTMGALEAKAATLLRRNWPAVVRLADALADNSDMSAEAARKAAGFPAWGRARSNGRGGRWPALSHDATKGTGWAAIFGRVQIREAVTRVTDRT